MSTLHDLPLDAGRGLSLRSPMIKLILAITSLCLAACANADGSRPRLGPAADLGSGPGSFNGGYAGTNGGFSSLTTKSTSF